MELRNVKKIEPMTIEQREQYVKTEGLANYDRIIPHFLPLPHIKLEDASNLKFHDIISDALDVMQETVGTVKITKKSDK